MSTEAEHTKSKKSIVPRLRFNEFREQWNTKKLNEVAEINPSNKNLPDRFIYIDLESVVKGQLLKEEEIQKIDSPSRAQRYLQRKDILFQMVRPYQMNNLFFDKVGDYVASTGYAQIRTKENSKFIYQYLHLQDFVDKVIERCTGTSYPSINSSDLGNIQIKYPSLLEQQKIASFLGAVDEKIQQLTRKKELLEQYKKGVMQQLFSGKLRFKDSNGKPYPKWEEKRLGEIGEIVTGKTPSTSDSSLWDGDVLFVTPTDMQGGKYQESTQRSVKNGDRIRMLPSKSVMFTCIASIGKMSLSVKPSITNQQINSIIPYNQFDNEFVYYSLLNIVDEIKATQSTTTLPIINKTEFSKFKIQAPESLKEQQKIASFLTALDAKIESVAAQIAHTQTFKKGLLQQMFI
ncbi:MAG: restriction endonuclease subunit S [Flammeovirgaceae bacterium]